MQLIRQNVTLRSGVWKPAGTLYCRAFPKTERLPLWLLLLLAKRSFIDFQAYYDEGVFCGFAYTVCVGDLVFVLYLAVDDTVRSRGYGSAILADLKEAYPSHGFVLNIEPLEEAAPNAAQRRKRFHFYQKNGYYDTGYKVVDKKAAYTVLSTAQDFSPERFQAILQKMSFGLSRASFQKTT